MVQAVSGYDASSHRGLPQRLLAQLACGLHWFAALAILMQGSLRTPLAAQSPYYNLHAGQPLRIEDAVPTERRELDVEFPAGRFEHLDAGLSRWRFESGISYGILPQTEIGVRSTFVYREPTAVPRGGLSSLTLTVMHAINTETLRRPAVAVAGEVYVPAGSARAGGTGYSIRTLVTRTGSIGRLHLNVSVGSYNVGVVQPAAICGDGPNFTIPCSGTVGYAPYIPDGPCLVVTPHPSEMLCSGGTPPPIANIAQTTDTVPMRGTHWLAGLAFDHALAVHSTLLMGEVYVERYMGLYALTDWTSQVGVRQQITPTIALDAGIGRHFQGTNPSWIFTFGGSYSAPLHRFGRGFP